MPETAVTTAPDEGAAEPGAPRDWGRALDVAGVAAGIVLAAIVADILTDGRLISRRLHRKRGDDDQPAD